MSKNDSNASIGHHQGGEFTPVSKRNGSSSWKVPELSGVLQGFMNKNSVATSNYFQPLSEGGKEVPIHGKGVDSGEDSFCKTDAASGLLQLNEGGKSLVESVTKKKSPSSPSYRTVAAGEMSPKSLASSFYDPEDETSSVCTFNKSFALLEDVVMAESHDNKGFSEAMEEVKGSGCETNEKGNNNTGGGFSLPCTKEADLKTDVAIDSGKSAAVVTTKETDAATNFSQTLNDNKGFSEAMEEVKGSGCETNEKGKNDTGGGFSLPSTKEADMKSDVAIDSGKSAAVVTTKETDAATNFSQTLDGGKPDGKLGTSNGGKLEAEMEVDSNETEAKNHNDKTAEDKTGTEITTPKEDEIEKNEDGVVEDGEIVESETLTASANGDLNIAKSCKTPSSPLPDKEEQANDEDTEPDLSLIPKVEAGLFRQFLADKGKAFPQFRSKRSARFGQPSNRYGQCYAYFETVTAKAIANDLLYEFEVRDWETSDNESDSSDFQHSSSKSHKKEPEESKKTIESTLNSTKTAIPSEKKPKASRKKNAVQTSDRKLRSADVTVQCHSKDNDVAGQNDSDEEPEVVVLASEAEDENDKGVQVAEVVEDSKPGSIKKRTFRRRSVRLPTHTRANTACSEGSKQLDSDNEKKRKGSNQKRGSKQKKIKSSNLKGRNKKRKRNVAMQRGASRQATQPPVSKTPTNSPSAGTSALLAQGNSSLERFAGNAPPRIKDQSSLEKGNGELHGVHPKKHDTPLMNETEDAHEQQQKSPAQGKRQKRDMPLMSETEDEEQQPKPLIQRNRQKEQEKQAAQQQHVKEQQLQAAQRDQQKRKQQQEETAQHQQQQEEERMYVELKDHAANCPCRKRQGKSTIHLCPRLFQEDFMSPILQDTNGKSKGKRSVGEKAISTTRMKDETARLKATHTIQQVLELQALSSFATKNMKKGAPGDTKYIMVAIDSLVPSVASVTDALRKRMPPLVAGLFQEDLTKKEVKKVGEALIALGNLLANGEDNKSHELFATSGGSEFLTQVYGKVTNQTAVNKWLKDMGKKGGKWYDRKLYGKVEATEDEGPEK